MLDIDSKTPAASDGNKLLCGATDHTTQEMTSDLSHPLSAKHVDQCDPLLPGTENKTHVEKV